jgi:hypothetical protein
MALITECAAHGGTVPLHHLHLLILAFTDGALEGTNPAHAFLQLILD